MFRRYFDDFDDFDDFFVPFYGRRRNVPRQALGNGEFLSLVPFSDDFSSQLTKFQGNEGFAVSNFEMKEDADKYNITLTIPDVKHKEIKVDFVKSENKLVILVSQKKEHKDQYYSSSYGRSMVLDKEVNPADINAELTAEGVKINIPKVESDVVNVSVGDSGVTHLLDAVPAEETSSSSSDVEEENPEPEAEPKGKAEGKL